MSNKLRISIIILLLLLGATAAMAQVSHAVVWNKAGGKYILTDLGKGQIDSEASDINSLGQIVGYSKDISGNRHAFLWNKVRGKYVSTDLGTLPGGEESAAVGINDHGQIIGWSYKQFTMSAVVWDKVGNKYIQTDLGSGSLYSINNNGQIAGDKYSIDGKTVPVIWNKGRGKYVSTTLGIYKELSTSASDINNRGQVIGTGNVIGAGVYHSDAIMWNKVRNAYAPIVMSPGYTFSTFPKKINDNGQTIGIKYTKYQSSPSYAVIWDNIGSAYTMTDLPGGVSNAYDINNNGQIIGVIDSWATGVYISNAVIWNKVRGKYVLTTLESNTEASGINNNGQIVGHMTY